MRLDFLEVLGNRRSAAPPIAVLAPPVTRATLGGAVVADLRSFAGAPPAFSGADFGAISLAPVAGSAEAEVEAADWAIE